MKRLQLATGLIAVFCLTLMAQSVMNQANAQAGTRVAVVDVPLIFKNHPRFKANMEAIKAEAKQFDQATLQRNKELSKKVEALKETLKPGTPEYRQQEAAIAQEMASLKVDVGLRRKEFMEREAQAFYQAYKEVEHHVGRVATHNGIGLVLRFASEEMDPQVQGSVQQGVNRNVVYQRDLNLTQLVMDELNRAAAPAAQKVGTRPFIPQRPVN